MGMSASQARLLSITSRLTNNEFRSQTITNSKLRLAEKSQEASAEYMDALNSQQLVFGVYSDNGEYTTQKLTPALIYDYAPLKNQYALVNPAGKMLVSAVDARNFENSNTLSEFLDNYGLLENVEYTQKVEKPNPNYQEELDKYNEDKPKYDAYVQYLKDKEQYDKDYKAWQERNPNYDQELEIYKNWVATMGDKNMYNEFSSIVGTSDSAIGDSSGTKYCYSKALNGDSGCYKHILNLVINSNGTGCAPMGVTTTTGESIMVNAGGGGTENSMDASQKDVMGMISNAMPYCKCDEDDDLGTSGKQNSLQEVLDAGTASDENIKLIQLKSDYKLVVDNDGTPILDANGKYQTELKTLYEKAVDLYYLIDNGLVTDPVEMKELLINFTDGDMKNVSVQAPEAPPVEPTPVAFTECPIKPSNIIIEYVNNSETTVNDKDKAQWYTNLWYMMNGSDTVNKVQQKEIFDDEKNESYSVFVVESAEKSGKGGTYEVFEDMSLFKSDDWLEFALEHGMVTMVQAQYTNPSADSGKVPELTSEGITWKSIIYTNASDIRSQEDEVAIAIAEVKYKNAIREIENKDKKFDQDLKKLDTEHTALQTEYDSIKEVISKNVDRSFKAFS